MGSPQNVTITPIVWHPVRSASPSQPNIANGWMTSFTTLPNTNYGKPPDGGMAVVCLASCPSTPPPTPNWLTPTRTSPPPSPPASSHCLLPPSPYHNPMTPLHSPRETGPISLPTRSRMPLPPHRTLQNPALAASTTSSSNGPLLLSPHASSTSTMSCLDQSFFLLYHHHWVKGYGFSPHRPLLCGSLSA